MRLWRVELRPIALLAWAVLMVWNLSDDRPYTKGLTMGLAFGALSYSLRQRERPAV